MNKLLKIILVLCCISLLAGCYEDEAEITLNSDGSGTLKQRLVISEHFLVASSEGKNSKNAPPVSEESVRKTIGNAIEIKSITQTEQPDGGRIIEFQGTFSNAEQFFLSDFCHDTLKLKLAPIDDGKAVIYSELSKKSGDISGPSTTQSYGLAKGMYIKRTVKLPGEIEKTNGTLGDDNKTVSWSLDLRNKEGLARTIAFENNKDKGVGKAFFDAAALEFSLPLKTSAVQEESSEEEKQITPADAGSLKAKVSWVAINKKLLLNSDSAKPEISDIELGIEVSWQDKHKPYACQTPVLTSIRDDLNNDLVKSGYQNTYEISSSVSKKELKVKPEKPDGNAQKIQEIEGYVPVITNIKKEKVVLENIYDLAGAETTGNPILDKLNFRFKEIKGHSIIIEIEGGHRAITSINIYGENENPIKRQGGWGANNSYTYNYAGEIPKLNKCEIEVIVSKDIVKVPFSLDQAAL